MSALLTKAIDKLPGSKKSSPANDVESRKSDSPNGRSIPPEPVQQRPEGDFRHQEQGPALQTLNLARANKRCAALSWDNHLGGDAEKVAEKMAASGKEGDAGLTRISTADRVEDESRVQPHGQCVFVRRAEENKREKDGEPTYEDAVKEWLAQETRYKGEPIQDGPAEYKAFTQCMWSETKHIGIGKAQASNGTWYVVARFTPPGNITGNKPF